MRLLTSLSKQESALRLVSYLAVKGIETKMEEDDGQWEIWVLQDDDRENAKQILDHFQEHPDDERYSKAERKVRNTLKEADRIVQERQKHTARLKKRWEGSWWHCYPATYVSIGLCCLVVIICTKPEPPRGMMLLPLCNNEESVLLEKMRILPSGLVDEDEAGNKVPVDFYYRLWPNPDAGFAGLKQVVLLRLRITAEALWFSISNGEFWRPLTPAFLHFSLLHILFNMMWMKNLGEAVEFTRGTGRFILVCTVIAIISNLAQLLWSGPRFGGMSGVVFGLIGYVWMKGKTQPEQGIGMTQRSITFAILWLVLCMANVFGPIANAAHLIGFLTGIVIGARKAIWKKLPFTA